MTKTRRQLVDMVLDKLGVLVPGQSPGDEAVDRVDIAVDPVGSMLAVLGIIYVADLGTPDPPSGGEIDDAVFLPLADYLAFQVAGAFNLGDSPSLKVLADQAEVTLRLIGRPSQTRQNLRTDTQLSGNTMRGPAGNFTQGT